MMRTYDRPLSDDDRALMTHIDMWGSSGYPVKKMAGRWTWDYRSRSASQMYRTKREATESFETYMGVLRDCAGNEAYRRAMAGAA